MANGDVEVTVTGNLTRDPELRMTAGGNAVASFAIAVTPRVYDRAAAEWKDGETQFFRCSVWRAVAEHVVDSLHKGDRVMVVGNLVQRPWVNAEGENKRSVEIDVREVGASLSYASVKIVRAARASEVEQAATRGWEPSEAVPAAASAPF